MADLEPITETFAADEPWTPQDPSRLSRQTRNVYLAWSEEHGDDGVHRDIRIGYCAVLVTVSGGVATPEAGDVNIDTVLRLKAGHYRITTNGVTFRGTDYWFPDVWAVDQGEPLVPVIDADLTDGDTLAKTAGRVDVKFYNATNGTLTDTDFFFVAYGMIE